MLVYLHRRLPPPQQTSPIRTKTPDSGWTTSPCLRCRRYTHPSFATGTTTYHSQARCECGNFLTPPITVAERRPMYSRQMPLPDPYSSHMLSPRQLNGVSSCSSSDSGRSSGGGYRSPSISSETTNPSNYAQRYAPRSDNQRIT